MNKNYPISVAFYGISFILFACSSDWFMMWLSLEMNTLSFLSILFQTKKNKTENMMTYFVIQGVSSLFMIMSMSSNEMWTTTHSETSALLLISVMVKLAAAPVHNWFVPVCYNTSSTLTLWLLLSMQKMMPLVFAMKVSKEMSMLGMLFIVLSAVMGSALNVPQTEMKMLVVFSSISNIGWLLLSISSTLIWQLFFLVYAFNTLMIMEALSTNMEKMKTKKKNNIHVLIVLMSMGGIPPLMGFFPKALVIMMMVKNNMWGLGIMMLFSSCMDLYIYSRMSILSFMSSNVSALWENVKLKQEMWELSTSTFLLAYMVAATM